MVICIKIKKIMMNIDMNICRICEIMLLIYEK